MVEPTVQLDTIYIAWKQQRISIANLALMLGEVLELMHHDLSAETYKKAFEFWGEIEIINAILLDEERTPTTEENGDVDRFVDSLYFLLRRRQTKD